MPKRSDRNVRVVPVPHAQPDLDRLAKAIVAMALKQLNEHGQVEAPDSQPVSPPSDGAAA